MARIRTVKPEFFKHHDLFKAEKETKLPLRLAFQGLWLCADKEGRFKYNPTHLKLDVLPYDDVDFRIILAALEAYGFIFRYSIEGKKYGVIPTLKDHQRFSGTEAKAESKLPAPPENIKSGISLEELREQYGSNMELPENNQSYCFEYDEIALKELPDNFQGTSEERRKGEKERSKEMRKEGKGVEETANQDLLGSVIYDAEKEILGSPIRFEQICMKTGKDPTTGKDVLRKYHLWLTEYGHYPKAKGAVFAGFEKWLMNEKKQVNGTQSGNGNGSHKLGTSEGRTQKAREWGSDFIPKGPQPT